MFNLEIDDLAEKLYIPQKKYFYEFVAKSFLFYLALEIKPCGLGSRIRDMEAESHN